MRRPIRLQLLWPMLLIVVLAVALTSLASAWSGGRRARQTERAHLQRLVETLAGPGFPLTDNVLRQLSGLSGAEFVVLDRREQVQAATMPLTDELVQSLALLQPATEAGALGPDALRVVDDQRYLAARLRLHGPGDNDSLLVLYPEDLSRLLSWEAAYPPLIAGAVAILLAILWTAWLTRRLVRPIEQLRSHTAGITAGAFQEVPLSDRDDELRDLGQAINRMVSRLGQYEAQIRHNERLRTLGQLGAGMAHQLRNSVTGARLALEFHEQELEPDVDHEALQVAVRQLTLMETYLQRFLKLGREQVVPHVPVALDQLVTDVLPLVAPACRHAGISLDWQPGPTPCRIPGDVEALRQLLLNMVLNAMEAATPVDGRTGIVRIELESGSDSVRLRVLDTGPGPAVGIGDRVFEPFVTDKPDGTGLGLSVARQIAVDHGASLGWERREGWTCFELRFPSTGSTECSASVQT